MQNDPVPSPYRLGLGGEVGETESGRIRAAQGTGGLVDRLRQHCEARMEDLRTVTGSGSAADAEASAEPIDEPTGDAPALGA